MEVTNKQHIEAFRCLSADDLCQLSTAKGKNNREYSGLEKTTVLEITKYPLVLDTFTIDLKLIQYEINRSDEPNLPVPQSMASF